MVQTDNNELPDDESEVEADGIDLDDEEEGANSVAHEDSDEDNGNISESELQSNESVAKDEIEMETIEALEVEEARKERLELLKAAEAKVQSRALADEGRELNTQERLEYLIGQSDVFAQFLAGSVARTTSRNKGGSRGKSGRMTEEEEDDLLLKSAQSKRHTVVRLDKQPSILSPECHMHSYQLEGLNWMIKLHDHGINGILADGKVIVSVFDGRSDLSLCCHSIFF